ncbi:tripartite tricarboxylate transporter TctB family protein [Vreelandella malpeensis]|uniref:Tripartite tricarboxylate transporter TctB family protein n=1 Tax=Vreelandella malpeensis TaxID=1172368 RepID=A0ABS8DN52_9GAMM|nr:tripartite tricarboxylate transporter TctB family protein [Halomonas malpeensis]MCB8887580.1 tripartite tricarboxylate transporter TctB family protein [Halomonas malpeensis]
MNWSRLSLGVFGVGLALFFFINNLAYPARAAQMPLIFSTAVGLLAVALIVQEIWVARKRAQLVNAKGRGVDSGTFTPAQGYMKAFGIFLLALVYAYSIGIVGYFIASVAFMAAALMVVREVSIKYALIGTLTLLGTIGAVFFYFLGLNMPALPSFL